MAGAPTLGLQDKYQACIDQFDEIIKLIEGFLDEAKSLPESIVPEPASVFREQLSGDSEMSGGVDIRLESEAEDVKAPVRREAERSSQPIEIKEKSFLVKLTLRLISIFIVFTMLSAGIGLRHGEGGFGSVLGLLFFLILATYLWGASLPSKGSACPQCNTAIKDITHEWNRCESCKAYLHLDKDSISLVSSGLVRDEPTFKITLPGEFCWSNRCCLCAGEPTRTLEASFRESQTGRSLFLGAAGLAAGALIVRRGGGSSGCVNVPYCDRCAEGTSLAKGGEGAEISFRSYGFYQDFCQVNGLTRACVV